MANMIVIPEEAFDAASLKTDQARTVTELLAHLDKDVQGTDSLREEAMSLIMALTFDAHKALGQGKRLVP